MFYFVRNLQKCILSRQITQFNDTTANSGILGSSVTLTTNVHKINLNTVLE